MPDTHFVTFPNLLDAETRKPVRLEVPNTLVYEGQMFFWRELGRQVAEKVLAEIRRES